MAQAYLGNTVLNQLWLGNTQINSVVIKSVTAIVQNFVNAVEGAGGSLSYTEITSLDTLVESMIAENIWSKMQFIYPLVGGTADSTKFNLVNTGSFTVNWQGGLTFNSGGVEGNGTTGYGDTNFIDAFDSFGDTDRHMASYVTTNQSQSDYDMGSFAGTREDGLISRFDDNLAYGVMGGGQSNVPPGVQFTSTSSFDSKGMWLTQISSSIHQGLYKNGTKIVENTPTSIGVVDGDILILASNRNGSPGNYSNKKYAWFSFGGTLTDAETTTFYNIVQDFQTSLSRQV